MDDGYDKVTEGWGSGGICKGRGTLDCQEIAGAISREYAQGGNADCRRVLVDI